VRRGLSRVLVTGGAGFIGSHIVDRLLAEDYRVTVLDDFSTGIKQNLRPHLDEPNFRFVKGDVRDKKIVATVVGDVDAVIHEAALTSVPLSLKNPKLANGTNVTGTLNLLESSLEKGVKRFIFASSAAVYGAQTVMPITENVRTRPLSPYGESKLNAEKKCLEFWKKYGFETICLRYFNVYGPRQTAGQYASVISRFFDRLQNSLPPIIHGDGKQTRDFVYVSDAVDATLLALGSRGAAGEVFNVGTGEAVSINYLCRTLQRVMRRGDLKPIHVVPRPGDIKHSQADITKAKKILGYAPKVSLWAGLKKFVAWRRSKGCAEA